MKEQRDRLVAMKKQKPESRLRKRKECKKNDKLKRMLESAAVIEQQRRKEGLEAKESSYSRPSKEEIERGRGAMRNALARRKMNLLLVRRACYGLNTNSCWTWKKA